MTLSRGYRYGCLSTITFRICLSNFRLSIRGSWELTKVSLLYEDLEVRSLRMTVCGWQIINVSCLKKGNLLPSSWTATLTMRRCQLSLELNIENRHSDRQSRRLIRFLQPHRVAANNYSPYYFRIINITTVLGWRTNFCKGILHVREILISFEQINKYITSCTLNFVTRTFLNKKKPCNYKTENPWNLPSINKNFPWAVVTPGLSIPIIPFFTHPFALQFLIHDFNCFRQWSFPVVIDRCFHLFGLFLHSGF